jgi:hypothetical protein
MVRESGEVSIPRSGVVPRSAVPEYMRTIFREVTDRGPGPGRSHSHWSDLREIDLAVDYGFNRQRPYAGTLPQEFTGYFLRIIKINREAKTAEVAPGERLYQ